ncbi:hypothetical protein ACMGG9_07785 [Serratia sp. BNK-10]|uniref:hypothetical protein n=1 Tax=Serratia sp. BNK-10 TaxID=3376147 RepID=UPI0039BF60D4
MTTIKRFTPDYAMHAARFEPFAREAEHGEYVRFDAHQQKVSALEAERDAQQKRADALAVENAGFKHALSVILEHVDVTDKGQADVVAMIANDELFNSETPATDAALAAIQAQGVEKLADKLDAEIEQIMRGAFFYDEISSREAISKMVREFATELREAK